MLINCFDSDLNYNTKNSTSTVEYYTVKILIFSFINYLKPFAQECFLNTFTVSPAQIIKISFNNADLTPLRLFISSCIYRETIVTKKPSKTGLLTINNVKN